MVANIKVKLSIPQEITDIFTQRTFYKLQLASLHKLRLEIIFYFSRFHSCWSNFSMLAKSCDSSETTGFSFTSGFSSTTGFGWGNGFLSCVTAPTIASLILSVSSRTLLSLAFSLIVLKNLIKIKTVNAIIRKSINDSINAPYSTATSPTPSDSWRRIYFLSEICTPSVITDKGGIITCFTMVFTTLLKAVPMIIPTAISSILPFIANSLNSLSMEVFDFFLLLLIQFMLIRQII